MEEIPLWAQILALLVLLALSAFFSIAETSMMALNRYRLGHLVREGRRGARLAADLLKQTESLLGTILLGNNVVNTALTAIVTSVAISQFGNNDRTILLATTGVALLIIIVCEITPKVIGATFPERVALPAGYVLRPLMRATSPAVWLINLIARLLMRSFGVRPGEASAMKMSAEELRTIVLETGPFMPQKHRSILLNLFDLENITVDDVMIPRNRIEALDIATSPAAIREQLATCYHNKLPVHEGDVNRTVGVLHVRRALALLSRDNFDDRRAARAAQRVLLRSERHAGLHAAAVLPGEPAAARAGRGRVRRGAGPGDARGHHRGDHRRVHDDGAGRWGRAAMERDGRGVRRRHGDAARAEPAPGHGLPARGPENPDRAHARGTAGHPEGEVSVRFGAYVVEVVHIQDRTIRNLRLRRLGAAPGPDSGAGAGAEVS